MRENIAPRYYVNLILYVYPYTDCILYLRILFSWALERNIKHVNTMYAMLISGFFSFCCRRTNRLVESRNIFDTIINNIIFQKVSFILFLNKTDLLEEKLKNRETNISWYFSDFKGDSSKLVDVQVFLLEYFKSAKRDRNKRLFHHFTTAVDTENIKVVFNAVKDTILQRNLQQLMLQ